jgi:hypothetical protein
MVPPSGSGLPQYQTYEDGKSKKKKKKVSSVNLRFLSQYFLTHFLPDLSVRSLHEF